MIKLLPGTVERLRQCVGIPQALQKFMVFILIGLVLGMLVSLIKSPLYQPTRPLSWRVRHGRSRKYIRYCIHVGLKPGFHRL